jgi:ubiquitin-conjugating enzyme E2 A
MTTAAKRRILQDFKKYKNEAAGMGVLINPLPNNMMCFEAIIIGPDDTEWEGGIFKLMMEFGVRFPTEPPKVRFITQMFHPNIYLNGQICLDILDNAWTPLYDCKSILTQI